MTNEERIASRIRRLVKDAARLGVVLVADADTPAVRVMSKDDLRANDLRDVGIAVQVESGCGGDPGGCGAACGIH